MRDQDSELIKYPRTLHIEGSGLQRDDNCKDAVPFKYIEKSFLVVEEKMDGANCAVSFQDDKLYLQSRGHYLTGGAREKQFDNFKSWAYRNQYALLQLLGNKYIMYGEWLYAKHTIFYDLLPDYFMEFDIYNKEEDIWLSTIRRNEMLEPYRSFISSVRVIQEGNLHQEELTFLSQLKSPFISKNNIENLISLCENRKDVKEDRVLKETDLSRIIEGLYIKEENDEEVLDRFKFVRKGFLDIVKTTGHWSSRPIINNLLREISE